MNCKQEGNAQRRTHPQPLNQPVVLNIDQSSSGVLLASIKSVRGAKTYDVRFGPVGAGGATPASWSMKTVAKIKPGDRRPDARYDVCDSGTRVRSARPYRVE